MKRGVTRRVLLLASIKHAVCPPSIKHRYKHRASVRSADCVANAGILPAQRHNLTVDRVHIGDTRLATTPQSSVISLNLLRAASLVLSARNNVYLGKLHGERARARARPRYGDVENAGSFPVLSFSLSLSLSFSLSLSRWRTRCG